MLRSCVSAALAVLCVSCAAEAGGTFGVIPDDEPANNIATSATIIDFPCEGGATCVATGDCALGLTDTDHFKFFAPLGNFIMVMTVPIGNLPDSFASPDTFLTLLGPNLAAVELNDTGGDDFPQPGAIAGSVIQHFASPAGEYVIRVNRAGVGAPGPYKLVVACMGGAFFLESPSNDTPATADRLVLEKGPIVIGAGSMAGNPDYFSVAMGAGDILSAATIPGSGTTLTLPDTILGVIAPDGVTLLAENDDADFPDLGSAVRFRAPAPGVYFLRETHFMNTPTGGYYLVADLHKAPHCAGDADGDGEIDFADITNVLQNFNFVCP